MRMTEPQPLAAVGGRLTDRLSGILAARGISVDAPATDMPPEPPAMQELAEQRIPPRYRTAIADHPDIDAWVHDLLASARSGPAGAPGLATGDSLLLAGPTGVGKTYLAYGAIRALLAAGVRMRWQATPEADLYAALRPRSGHDSERELHTLIRSPLLLIDDLGAAKASEWTEELLYRLINHRYEQLLPTLITTNLPIRDLRTKLGDRIASRLAEMTRRITLTGVDRRRQHAA